MAKKQVITDAASAATSESITPNADELKKLKSALTDADASVQGSSEKIDAAAKSIKLLLREPDSSHNRLTIKALCELIEYHSFDAMNSVNWLAEQHGAHWIYERDRSEEHLICEAAREGKAQEASHV